MPEETPTSEQPDELDVEQWDDDDLDEAADIAPPQPADGGAFLAEADKEHDQDEYDQAEADRQLDAVDDEGE